MSVAVKMYHTDFVVESNSTRVFRVPTKVANSVLEFITPYEIPILKENEGSNKDDEFISIDEVFKDYYAETSKPATLLRGYRLRNELTQAELAKYLKTSQAAVAAMESAKRPISLSMAKKLATFFNANYKDFT
jgi:DNA-binding XRE family transcriptional regulator